MVLSGVEMGWLGRIVCVWGDQEGWVGTGEGAGAGAGAAQGRSRRRVMCEASWAMHNI